jgi:diacylglycerol kinase (ATP)
MLNSALEFLAVAITKEYDRYVKAALDVSSAAVLLASVGSVCIGLIIFINRIGLLLGWW